MLLRRVQSMLLRRALEGVYSARPLLLFETSMNKGRAEHESKARLRNMLVSKSYKGRAECRVYSYEAFMNTATRPEDIWAVRPGKKKRHAD